MDNNAKPQGPQNQVTKFSQKIQAPSVQALIQRTLGDPKQAQMFIASISSLVATNPELQQCEADTVINGALLGAALRLVPSPQLGQYYLLPFKDSQRGKIAVFVLGYKGYIQLAIRSGYYKRINVLPIKKGELTSWNPLTEEFKVTIKDDYAEVADGVFTSREDLETIGYYASFEYLNGFTKTIYWTKAKMMSHADTYSPAFKASEYARLQAGSIPKNELWKYSSFWYKNFDEMAMKTMIRQLISRWGIMSVEMQQAYESDNEEQPLDMPNTPGVVQNKMDAAGSETIPTDITVSDEAPEPQNQAPAADKPNEAPAQGSQEKNAGSQGKPAQETLSKKQF